MSNTELTTIDSSSLVTATGGRAWDTTAGRAAVGDSGSIGNVGSTVGPQQPRESLGDRLKTIYGPSPTVPQPQSPIFPPRPSTR